MNQEELLEKYKDILESNARKYACKSNDDYTYWYNEVYFILLDSYRKNPLISSEKLIKNLNSKLRNSYRKEIKEKHILYGLNPEENNIKITSESKVT